MTCGLPHENKMSVSSSEKIATELLTEQELRRNIVK